MKHIQPFFLAAGLAMLGTAPALSLPVAIQSYVSGSTSAVFMNGASQSLGAEIAGAVGTVFDSGTVGLTPLLATPAGAADTGLGTNANNYASFAVAPGALSNTAISTNASVEAAVAARITTAGVGATLADGVSYTRAWQSGLQ